MINWLVDLTDIIDCWHWLSSSYFFLFHNKISYSQYRSLFLILPLTSYVMILGYGSNCRLIFAAHSWSHMAHSGGPKWALLGYLIVSYIPILRCLHLYYFFDGVKNFNKCYCYSRRHHIIKTATIAALPRSITPISLGLEILDIHRTKMEMVVHFTKGKRNVC